MAQCDVAPTFDMKGGRRFDPRQCQSLLILCASHVYFEISVPKPGNEYLFNINRRRHENVVRNCNQHFLVDATFFFFFFKFELLFLRRYIRNFLFAAKSITYNIFLMTHFLLLLFHVFY